MKILMQGRFGLLHAPGGDRVQIEQTAMELRKLGVTVDIVDTNVPDLSSYDLVHVFQLDWTPETYFYIRHAKKSGKRVAFSPIHHNVAEVTRFDDLYAFGFRRLARLLFKDQFSRDTIKNLYRSIFNPLKLFPTIYSVFFGLKNMQVWSLRMADKILVQTQLEARDLRETYSVFFEYDVIPNGVGTDFLHAEFRINLGFSDYILSVGRIEPRKNQLTLISAVEKVRDVLGIDIQLVLIGKLNIFTHLEYTLKFLSMLKKYPWVKHIEQVPYSNIADYFGKAKVCVSASWFETTGLTLLEALFCKTNAVSTSPRAREIIGDFASYCVPSDVASIATAIKTEYLKPRPNLPSEFLSTYTWKNAAIKTLAVYKELL